MAKRLRKEYRMEQIFDKLDNKRKGPKPCKSINCILDDIDIERTVEEACMINTEKVNYSYIYSKEPSFDYYPLERAILETMN